MPIGGLIFVQALSSVGDELDSLRHGSGMPAVNPKDIKHLIAGVVKRAPDWLRHDLSSNNALQREQAEEALAAMVATAVLGSS